MQAAREERQEQAEGESLHWDGTTCVASFAGRLCGHTKRCLEEGRGTGGSHRQESEQRGKWSWRVCQGSAILYHHPA
ncbi:hypothetical protein PBY51_024499 [Eleginops maclovinus]|uniref:Uncharacterized protein n=1 Tax=Eleginops maclovinus TaxID=56733 RepID=A0AAN7Y000_ELEMC|nr:hypothetical protein PBY51_024499 [Eleginops maclovinus]